MRNSKAFKTLLSEYAETIYVHAHEKSPEYRDQLKRRLADLERKLVKMFQEAK
jgi:hypothetical protein